MAEFHFVQDYERLISDLVAAYPIDEAMEKAVGGNYQLMGRIERAVLRHTGLKDGMTVVDLGCGSGRLGHALAQEYKIEYTGIDIVEALLAYARTKTPANYKFILNRKLTLPVETGTADMLCAFSVFTHLLHTETYLYLEEMRRALKPTGKVIFSFLEFAEKIHWPIFVSSVSGQRDGTSSHLNTFIERDAIRLWCENLNFACEEIIDGPASPHGEVPLGQSIAILRAI